MSNEVSSSSGFPVYQRSKLIIYIGIACLLNLIMALAFEPSSAQHLDGSMANRAEIRSASLVTLIFTFTLIGALLGLLVAIFPYKGLSYLKRYPRAFLLTLLSLHCLWLVGNLFALAIM
jgi:hypothetical protein